MRGAWVIVKESNNMKSNSYSVLCIQVKQYSNDSNCFTQKQKAQFFELIRSVQEAFTFLKFYANKYLMGLLNYLITLLVCLLICKSSKIVFLSRRGQKNSELTTRPPSLQRVKRKENSRLTSTRYKQNCVLVTDQHSFHLKAVLLL